jgi:hypothetical protein
VLGAYSAEAWRMDDDSLVCGRGGESARECAGSWLAILYLQ